MEAHPGGGAPEGHRLPPSSRITRDGEIRALLREGLRKKTSHLDVFFLSSQGLGSRVGLVVPKYRHRTSERNRVKRRLRDVSRKEVLPRLRQSGVRVDLLVRARPGAYETTYRQLRSELVEVAQELCSGPSSWR